MAGDARAELLARSLVEWQWPDGGWNCDPRASGRRSSFHESLPPAWGLHEYWLSSGAAWAREAAGRAAELFLSHRLFRSLRDGEVVDRRWLVLHHPPYWHYDVLQALLILSRLGKARDPRAADALDLLLRRRRADGRWQPGGCWWRPPGTTSRGSYPVEVVDWGRSGPNELITLNALRVLHAAGWPGRPAPAAPDSSSDEPQPAGRHGPEADTPLGGREQDQRTERSQRWSS